MKPTERATETRAFKGVEIRAAAEGSKYIGTLTGYAAVFNSPSRELRSRDGGKWTEIILPGAFTRALKSNADVFALNQHDETQVLARRSAGTLRLEEDQRGLRIEMDLIDTQRNRDLLADVRAGHIDSMSFGMPVGTVKSKWERRNDGTILRSISDTDLLEVSAVTFPAYEASEISSRSLEEYCKESSTTPVCAIRARVELEKLS